MDGYTPTKVKWSKRVNRDETRYTLEAQQPSLFEFDSENERKFKEYHAKNPRVYRQLVKLAREAKAKGKTKLSIELLVNIVRWFSYLETVDDSEPFKISNCYKPYYARLIMEQEPDLDNIFNIRGKS